MRCSKRHHLVQLVLHRGKCDLCARRLSGMFWGCPTCSEAVCQSCMFVANARGVNLGLLLSLQQIRAEEGGGTLYGAYLKNPSSVRNKYRDLNDAAVYNTVRAYYASKRGV